MAAYAKTADVEAGFRALDAEEQNRCSALLTEAGVLIDAVALDATLDAKRVASCRMVRRAIGRRQHPPRHFRWVPPRAACPPWATRRTGRCPAAPRGSCTCPRWRNACWALGTALAATARWKGWWTQMFKGIPVILLEKAQSGVDGFGAPIYSETAVTVKCAGGSGLGGGCGGHHEPDRAACPLHPGHSQGGQPQLGGAAGAVLWADVAGHRPAPVRH